MQEVLVRTPQLLTLSVDYHLKPKLSFFHQELHMPKESIQRLIQKHPNIFVTHRLENNIRPKLMRLFSRRLLFEPVHLSKMLKLYPQILDRSLNDYLLPLAQYFLKKLMFSPLELWTILTQFPRLSSYSLVRIKWTEEISKYYWSKLQREPRFDKQDGNIRNKLSVKRREAKKVCGKTFKFNTIATKIR